MQTFWKNVEDMSLPFLLKYFENGPDNIHFIWDSDIYNTNISTLSYPFII